MTNDDDAVSNLGDVGFPVYERSKAAGRKGKEISAKVGPGTPQRSLVSIVPQRLEITVSILVAGTYELRGTLTFG